MRAFDTRFCERCQCEREFTRKTAAHRWHLAATILTLGMWGVGWLAVAITEARRPWRCAVCRSRFVPEAKRHPQIGQPTPDRDKLPIAPRKGKKPF